MKQLFANHIKNIHGWKTSRKLVAFAVDDYGNVRLSSENARQKLIKEGLKMTSRFDNFDSLDTTDDYLSLFEVLNSFKDINGNPAIISPYALPCNINFEETREKKHYVYETLDQTYIRFESLFPKSYTGTMKVLREGIDKGLIRPQFHGREHLNVFVINELLKNQDKSLHLNFDNYSMTALNSLKDFPNLKYSSAFAYSHHSQTEMHPEILKEGLNLFGKVYGYASLTFTPPSQEFNIDHYGILEEMGVFGINKGRRLVRLDKNGKSFLEKAKLGLSENKKHISILRNVVFEPTEKKEFDWSQYAFEQIKAAFFWNKPAIISSHRVNFCGHIDENNRKTGLDSLKELLKKVTRYYPDVEFISVDELTKIICKENGISII